jgi:hypothetical protein
MHRAGARRVAQGVEMAALVEEIAGTGPRSREVPKQEKREMKTKSVVKLKSLVRCASE